VKNEEASDPVHGTHTQFTGEIYNPGSNEVKGVRLVISVLDENRRVVESGHSLVLEIIPPDASISFDIKVEAGLDEWTEYEISLEEGPF
jgi:hypothetical protein